MVSLRKSPLLIPGVELAALDDEEARLELAALEFKLLSVIALVLALKQIEKSVSAATR